MSCFSIAPVTTAFIPISKSTSETSTFLLNTIVLPNRSLASSMFLIIILKIPYITTIGFHDPNLSNFCFTQSVPGLNLKFGQSGVSRKAFF